MEGGQPKVPLSSFFAGRRAGKKARQELPPISQNKSNPSKANPQTTVRSPSLPTTASTIFSPSPRRLRRVTHRPLYCHSHLTNRVPTQGTPDPNPPSSSRCPAQRLPSTRDTPNSLLRGLPDCLSFTSLRLHAYGCTSLPKMDAVAIRSCIIATLDSDPNNRKRAEMQLKQVRNAQTPKHSNTTTSTKAGKYHPLPCSSIP